MMLEVLFLPARIGVTMLQVRFLLEKRVVTMLEVPLTLQKLGYGSLKELPMETRIRL